MSEDIAVFIVIAVVLGVVCIAVDCLRMHFVKMNRKVVKIKFVDVLVTSCIEDDVFFKIGELSLEGDRSEIYPLYHKVFDSLSEGISQFREDMCPHDPFDTMM